MTGADSSVDLVLKAARFESPERIPYDVPEKFGSDFVWVKPAAAPGWKPGLECEDEWGCVWEHAEGDSTVGYVHNAPLQDYRDLDGYPFPDFTLSERYDAARSVVKGNDTRKFVVANTRVSFFQRLTMLRGFDSALTDAYSEPANLHILMNRILEMEKASIKGFAEAGVDGVFWCDDLGQQDRSLMSAEVFREHYKPFYEQAWSFAHSKGLLTLMHSCGNVIDLLDDLIDAGLDVVQLDQVESMGVDLLAERFGGRICFWCPVDIQGTMIHGSVEDVENAARDMIDKLGSYNGGFIGKYFWMPGSIGLDEKKVDAMSRVYIEYGSLKGE